jgi:hypothetical protein
MLDYNIINKKNHIYYINDNGIEEEFIDLLSKTCDFSDISFSDDEIIIVNNNYVARPDLISLAIYGSDQYADIICKYNGISNPFELNENDIIRLPNAGNIQRMAQRFESKSDLISDSNSIISTKKYEHQKEINEKRSPNESVVGEENFVIDKSLGVVFY